MRIRPHGAEQVEGGKQPVGGESGEEETLPAFLVVDELASEGQVEAVGGLSEIHQLYGILSEVIREHAVGRSRAIQLQKSAGAAFYDVDGVHGNGVRCGVAYADTDVSPRLVLVHTKFADEVRHAGQAGVVYGEQASRSQLIVEGRNGSGMAGIKRGSKGSRSGIDNDLGAQNISGECRCAQCVRAVVECFNGEIAAADHVRLGGRGLGARSACGECRQR